MVYKWEMQPFMVLYGCTHIYIICNDRRYITNHVILMGMNGQEKYGTSMDLFAVDFWDVWDVRLKPLQIYPLVILT